MTTGVVFLHECIILDACCIINLYASRQFGHILEAIPASVAVATYIQEKEALKIYGGPAEDVMQKEEQIDLQPFIDRGLLLPVSPESEAENVTYVNFAASLDDGEAITGAIAVHRNWAIGSDDRRAISLFAKEAPQLQRISTLELMKHWVGSTGLPADVVRSALRNVRFRAKLADIAPIKLDQQALKRLHQETDRLTTAYTPAITLIELLLASEGISIDESHPDQRLPGFLFDMNRFFQELLAHFLNEYLQDYTVQPQFEIGEMLVYVENPQHHQAPKPRPDYVVKQSGKVVAVLDAKYRDLWEKPLPPGMLYQLVMYALSQEHCTSATILYPTIHAEAREAKIEVRVPTYGKGFSYVVLRPVHLLQLETLLVNPDYTPSTILKSRSTPDPTSKPAPHSPPPGTTFLTYHGHSGWMTTTRWSPNGRYIASGSADKTVQVWDAATGGNILIYHGHSNTVYDVAWSPDGTRIASCSWDNTVQIWDVSTGTSIFTYRSHTGYVFYVAWSPDGTHIASSGNDNTVQVWEVATGTTLYSYRGHSDYVRAAIWSPNGQRIASASHDRTAQVWDATDGGNAIVYRGHSDEVNAIGWSPSGQLIATSGADRTVQVWNASNGDTVFTYHGHSAKINALGWSPDGARIVSGDDFASVQVWQAP